MARLKPYTASDRVDVLPDLHSHLLLLIDIKVNSFFHFNVLLFLIDCR